MKGADRPGTTTPVRPLRSAMALRRSSPARLILVRTVPSDRGRWVLLRHSRAPAEPDLRATHPADPARGRSRRDREPRGVPTPNGPARSRSYSESGRHPGRGGSDDRSAHGALWTALCRGRGVSLRLGDHPPAGNLHRNVQADTGPSRIRPGEPEGCQALAVRVVPVILSPPRPCRREAGLHHLQGRGSG